MMLRQRFVARTLFTLSVVLGIVSLIAAIGLILSAISMSRLNNGFSTKNLTVTDTFNYIDPTKMFYFNTTEQLVKGDFVSVQQNGYVVKGYNSLPWLELPLTGNITPLADGAYGQIGESLYLLGGSINGFSTVDNNVYKIDLKTFVMTQINTIGPGPSNHIVFNPYSVADEQRSSVWMYGGWDGSGGTLTDFSATLFRYVIPTKTWIQYPQTPSVPGFRSGGDLLVSNDFIYLYGGFHANTLTYDGTMYRTSASSPGIWSIVPPITSTPGPRTDYVWLKYKQKSIFFGGTPSGSGSRNDVWQYKPLTNEWTELVPNNGLNIAPNREVGGKGVIIGDFLYVYGGARSIRVFDDLWAFDLINLVWSELSSRGIKKLYRNYIGILPSNEIALFGGFTRINNANSNTLFKFSLPRKPIGVVCKTSGSTVLVQTVGIVRDVYSGLNPGIPVYVTDTGNITQLQFQPFGYYTGIALSNKTILLTP